MRAGTMTARKRSRSRGGTVPVVLARTGAAFSAGGPLGAAALPLPGAPPLGGPPGFAVAAGVFSGFAIALRLVHGLTALPADPDAAAIGQDLHSDAGRLVALPADQHHVGDVQRPFALDDPALPQLLGRPLVALDHVHVLDDHPAAGRDDEQDLAPLALL